MQSIVQVLDLAPETYRLRDAQTVAAPVLTPSSADTRWQLLRQADAPWSVRDVGFSARATLPLVDGRYLVADPGGTPRSVRTPRLVASGLRTWEALELYDEAPTGTSVTYRLRTGGVEYYWTGAAWAAATLAAHWGSRAATVANVATLTRAGRDLAVVARLATTDPAVSPAFYGAAIAYGVREVGDLDDALVRGLQAALVSGIAYTTVVELKAPAGGLTALRLSGDGAEYQLAVSSVEAVYNLTADPLEASPLAGAYASGVWAPSSPVAAAAVVRAYVVAVPRVIARSHRDAEQIDRLPAVYLAPGGPPSTRRAQHQALVRDVDAATGAAMASPALVDQELAIRVIGELGADVQRIVRALAAWLGASEERVLVSPVSGRVIEVRATESAYEASGTLAQGVVESRLAWSVSYRAERADILRAVDVLAEGGLTVGLTTGS